MIWFLITGGIGIDFENGRGWFLDAMSLGQFLPLVVLEVFFITQNNPQRTKVLIFSSFLFLCGLATIVGVALLAFGMWFELSY